MTTSIIDPSLARAKAVVVTDDTLSVDLLDGRTIAAPLAWFPRLLHASPAERANHRFIGDHEGIHWPDIDEDISIISLLAGRRSSENPAALQRWLSARNQSKS